MLPVRKAFRLGACHGDLARGVLPGLLYGWPPMAHVSNQSRGIVSGAGCAISTSRHALQCHQVLLTDNSTTGMYCHSDIVQVAAGLSVVRTITAHKPYFVLPGVTLISMFRHPHVITTTFACVCGVL